MKLIFLKKERKKERRKAKIGEITSQNNSRAGKRSQEGVRQMQAIVSWEKIKL